MKVKSLSISYVHHLILERKEMIIQIKHIILTLFKDVCQEEERHMCCNLKGIDGQQG